METHYEIPEGFPEPHEVDELVTPLWLFNDLPLEVQEKVIEKYYDWDTSDSYWYESTIDCIKDSLESVGFSIDNIYFSLSYSQSDYTVFTGNYSYCKGGQLVMFTDLEDDIQALKDLQRKHFYSLEAKIETGLYNSLSVDAWRQGDWASTELTEELKEIFRSISETIYSILRDEYEHLTGWNHLSVAFSDNDYLFDENGEMHY